MKKKVCTKFIRLFISILIFAPAITNAAIYGASVEFILKNKSDQKIRLDFNNSEISVKFLPILYTMPVDLKSQISVVDIKSNGTVVKKTTIEPLKEAQNINNDLTMTVLNYAQTVTLNISKLKLSVYQQTSKKDLTILKRYMNLTLPSMYFSLSPNNSAHLKLEITFTADRVIGIRRL